MRLCWKYIREFAIARYHKYIAIDFTDPAKLHWNLTTRLPMTTVARKNGIHETSPTSIQSHIDSIHSPHSTRNTIMNECMKSVKFQRGKSPSGKRSTLSGTRTREHTDTHRDAHGERYIWLECGKDYSISSLFQISFTNFTTKCMYYIRGNRNRTQ